MANINFHDELTQIHQMMRDQTLTLNRVAIDIEISKVIGELNTIRIKLTEALDEEAKMVSSELILNSPKYATRKAILESQYSHLSNLRNSIL